jgi:tetratricopeptide (TPR) repeat protein
MIVGLGLLVYWIIARQEPRAPVPASPVQKQSSYRDDLLRQLAKDQRTALEMFAQRKPEAIAQIDKNLAQVDKALASFPDDANFHSLMGYTLKDMYQSSKGLLPTEKRREYLSRARKSFEQSLRLDPNNAGAHNGMGNVLFFEGKFDAAITEHDIALRLTGGKYDYAEHDKQLVLKVRNGEIPFDF